MMTTTTTTMMMTMKVVVTMMVMMTIMMIIMSSVWTVHLFSYIPSSDSERVGTKNASYFSSSSGLRPHSLAARLHSCVLHR